MNETVMLWIGFTFFALVLIAIDLGVLNRGNRAITARRALVYSAGYFALAMAFAAGVFYFRGNQAGIEFVTGYLIEYSLSLDNIFVIALIFGHFAVPPAYQHRVLFWGILGALVMRATFILLGSALIVEFRWIVYVFGAFLIFTGIKMLMTINDKPDLANNRLIAFIRRRMRVTEEYHGQNFWVRRDGLLYATPLLLALALVEMTDLVFALDSIPAIFAVTQDPFIVYTDNVFAIMGLRALYFALEAVIHRFHYLKYGLSLVLLVVGAKMMLVDVYKVPTWAALAATGLLIGGSIVLSLFKTRGQAAPPAETTGGVPGSPKAAGGETAEGR